MGHAIDGHPVWPPNPPGARWYLGSQRRQEHGTLLKWSDTPVPARDWGLEEDGGRSTSSSVNYPSGGISTSPKLEDMIGVRQYMKPG
jgi:hypothetical protein